MFKNYIDLGIFKIFYDNKQAAESIIKGIFKQNYITITQKSKSPFIIDCGSHIGVSVMFFKTHYPASKILAFEPDPHSFKFLKKNVTINNLINVTIVNKGVYKDNGKYAFSCNHHSYNADNRGSSFISEWGNQCDYAHETLYLETVKLSSHISQVVDFLKLDIEAAEEIVLKEISNKLHLIKELSIEVHQSKELSKLDNLEKIIQLLTDYNFSTTVFEHKISFIPTNKENWFNRIDPKIFMIHAINLDKNLSS